jgi:FkbM family methyltransferase
MKFSTIGVIGIVVAASCFAEIDVRYGKYRHALENVINFRLHDHKSAMELVKRMLPPNPFIVDAGAFDGGDSVYMAQLWPQGTVFSFEPVPEIFKWLATNTKNSNNIFCFPLALSDKEGFSTFFTSEEPQAPGVPSMSGSLLLPKEHLIYSATKFNDVICVPTTTLDSWAQQHGVDHIDLLWLDMQGHELTTIKASPEILKTVQAIYTEVEFVEAYEGQPLFDDIYTWMVENGFVLISTNARLGNFFWFADALFLKRELLLSIGWTSKSLF